MSVTAAHPRIETNASIAKALPNAWPGLLVVGTVILLTYGPLLWMFVHQQWEKPQYQYFPFVIAAFAWLLWQRYREGTPLAVAFKQSHRIDSALQFAAAALLLSAILINSPWCAMISLIVLMAAVCRAISRTRHVTNLWGIWVLLWLIVPLPFSFDQRLTKLLQLASSRVSSYVLDWFGIYHLMEGNTLWLQSKPLFVDEACSGIISMLSIIACAVVFAVVMNRAPLHLLLLATAGVAWAAIMNVARIAGIAVALERWGIDWSAGASHEILSLALFLMAFLALLSTDQVLLVCLGPLINRGSDERTYEMHIGRWLAQAWDAAVTFGNPFQGVTENRQSNGRSELLALQDQLHVSWFAMLLFVPAAVVQLSILCYAFNVSGEYRPAIQRAMAMTANDMPASLCGLNKVAFNAYERTSDNVEGAHSRAYQYRSDDGTTYTLSCDYPFVEYWHELTECYRGNGWEFVSRRTSSEAGTSISGSWGFVEADFSKPSGEAAALFFSEFDQIGTPYERERDWTTNPLSFWESRYVYLKPHRLFQVQVWVTAPNVVTASQQKTARELMLAARELLRSRITAASSDTIQPKHETEQSAGQGAASIERGSAEATPSRPNP